MRLRVRMGIIAAIICLVPLLLVGVFTLGIAHYQTEKMAKEYGINTDELSLLRNPMAIYGRLAKQDFQAAVKEVDSDPSRACLLDKSWADKWNQILAEKDSFLIIRRADRITYSGNWEITSKIQNELPKYASTSASSLGTYIAESYAVLVKQKDFRSGDGMNMSLFIVTDVNTILPMWKNIGIQAMLSFLGILLLTASLLLLWLYNGIVKPLAILRVATKQIADGNLECEIQGDSRDEIGQLQNDFDDMRIHLKEMVEAQERQREDSRQIMSSLSHDLKTPLTAIKGYAEGILDGVASTPEMQRKYLNIILSKATAMEQLVEEIHLLNRMDNNTLSYTFRLTPIKPYMDDFCEEMAMDMSTQGITLTYDCQVGADVMVWMDPEHFHRVIDNIVGNAAKYMDKPDGKIHVEVTQEPGKVWIAVTDNGSGIKKENLEHIFERFYRGDAARSTRKGGSGLGLFIVKTIVEIHGGTIQVESEEGTGTTMRFSVLTENAPQDVPEQPE